MAENDLIKAIAVYNGHTIRKNFDVELKLRFIDEQLPNALQFVACIGKQVKLNAKVLQDKFHIGVFNVNRITIDKNGNAFVSFMSNNDYVNLESIEKLMVEDDIRLVGKITEIKTDEDEE